MGATIIAFPRKRGVALVEKHEVLGTWAVMVRWADGRVTREAGDFHEQRQAEAEAVAMAVTNGWALAAGYR